jgi:hypothetical protein
MAHSTYTSIKIISLALTSIGKGPINSIAGAGEFATSAEDAYNLLYPTCLVEGGWRFAVKTQELSRNVDDPSIDDWSYSWALPADYLSMVRLSPNVDYNIFGTDVYTNALPTNLYAIYYYQIPEQNLPPYFVKYLVYLLAAHLAWGVARDKALAKVYEDKALDALVKGQAVDAKAHPNVSFASDPYVIVRKTGYNRAYR